MNKRIIINNILIKKYKFKNKIYLKNFDKNKQLVEFSMRTKILNQTYKNYFDEISRHHSIEVMYDFVKKFLSKIKKNGSILDIGCGWCWHWKNINKFRPDIKIYALDFVIENFTHAQKLLKKKDLKKIYFIHDNFENFKLSENFFDGVWSCQTFQHIGNFEKNYDRVKFLLKKNAPFYNFNLNYSVFKKIKNLKKNQKKEIFLKNFYYLNKNIDNQIKVLNKKFSSIKISYCEYLFHPEIKLFFGGKDSLVGILDSYLSGKNIFKNFARQVLLESYK